MSNTNLSDCATPEATAQAEGGEIITAFGELPPKTLLTKKALAGILHVTEKSVERRVDKGELPCAMRMGRKDWWTVEAITEHTARRLCEALADRERLAKKII